MKPELSDAMALAEEILQRINLLVDTLIVIREREEAKKAREP